jgi:NAD(P)H-hydrate repair Nnr-like enzyme with NAD(P)H-hydrate epimerase domain
MRDEKSEKPKVPPPCPTVHHILLIVAPGDNGGEGVAHAALAESECVPEVVWAQKTMQAVTNSFPRPR